jgi:hypothetical protein
MEEGGRPGCCGRAVRLHVNNPDGPLFFKDKSPGSVPFSRDFVNIFRANHFFSVSV